MGMFDFLGKALGGIGKLFGGGGGGGMASTRIPSIGFPSSGAAMSALGGGGGSGWGGALKNIGGGFGSMFGGKQGLMGLGLTGLGAMIPNAKAPGMPSEFSSYFNQLKSGGTPGMQSANQYYQNILSGNNQGAYDAATQSIDENMEEERRKLVSMYKTLRPGTDPTTDSTFQRDQALLEDRYARNRALAMAGVQQGAASGAAGLGQNLAGLQGGAVQQYVDQMATQWGMNQSQRQALRQSVMGLGGTMAGNAMDPNAGMNKMINELLMKKLAMGV